MALAGVSRMRFASVGEPMRNPYSNPYHRRRFTCFYALTCTFARRTLVNRYFGTYRTKELPPHRTSSMPRPLPMGQRLLQGFVWVQRFTPGNVVCCGHRRPPDGRARERIACSTVEARHRGEPSPHEEVRYAAA